MTKKTFFTLILIIILGLGLRLTGLNWDQGQHLHPDERFLTMVLNDIKLSDLNPANFGYDFYAYGNLPLFITKLIGHIFSLETYDQIYLVGRVLSAIFDVGIILILYFLCQLLKLKNKTTLIICFFYAISIFPIQLSHFFTVDSFTVFFSTLSVYFFINYTKYKKFKNLLISAVIFGVTLSCKTSIIITLPVFLFYIFIISNKYYRILNPILFLFLIFVCFRIFQPFAFDGLLKFSPQFIRSINVAHQMITGKYQYPPNIQWLSTLPLIHPLINIFLFGLGPIMTILVFIGVKKFYKFHFIFLFSLIIFIYQGIQLAKYMRYFYPIYPFLIISAGIGFEKLKGHILFRKVLIVLIITNTLLFFGIYTRENSRIEASKWICQNLKSKNISYEYWDDPLPLNINNQCNNNSFNLVKLTTFDIEDENRLLSFNKALKNIEYLVLSSNRFWSSISKNKNKYPNAAKFYQSLFNNQTGFKKIKTFYSYPGIFLPFLKQCILIGPSSYPELKLSYFDIDKCSNPGIYFRDNIAEESFTVYDHPEVIIFAKN